MSMLRKRFLLLILGPLTVGLLGLLAVPRDTVQEIQLGGTLYAGQSVFENYRYRLLMKNALDGDASALESLVMFDCGGGAGCYDHGEVLVQLLSKAGDAKFSSMVRMFSTETRYQLRSLLDVGFEYGSYVQTSDSEVRFPITTKMLAALPK